MAGRGLPRAGALVLWMSIAAAIALSGCGGSSSTAKKTLAPLPGAGQGGPRGARPVGFRASDGVGLRGRLFGHGEAAVVLAHMGNATSNQSDWYPLARRLTHEGYAVLTFNMRGVCSEGE